MIQLSTATRLIYSFMEFTKMFDQLEKIYPSNNSAKPGPNTKKLFATLPISDNENLNLHDLQKAIEAWDNSYSYPYPENIKSEAFETTTIADVPVSLYKSLSGSDETPTVVLLHGGGFFCELACVHQSLMANIIASTGSHGVLPHYALSPKYKAPQAINDTVEVLKALLSNSEEQGLTKNLVVIGYSSGGNLAWNAIAKLLNQEDTGTLIDKVQHLILLSPWVDLSMNLTKQSPYQAQQNSDLMLTTDGLEQFRDWYLPEEATGMEPQYSPIYSEPSKLYGMPKTTIIVGEIDRLLGDAIATTQLFRSARVPTELVILEGQSHNHSCHNGLKDGIFTADIINKIIQNEPIHEMRGLDNLGIEMISSSNSSLNSNDPERPETSSLTI